MATAMRSSQGGCLLAVTRLSELPPENRTVTEAKSDACWSPRTRRSEHVETQELSVVRVFWRERALSQRRLWFGFWFSLGCRGLVLQVEVDPIHARRGAAPRTSGHGRRPRPRPLAARNVSVRIPAGRGGGASRPPRGSRTTRWWQPPWRSTWLGRSHDLSPPAGSAYYRGSAYADGRRSGGSCRDCLTGEQSWFALLYLRGNQWHFEMNG